MISEKLRSTLLEKGLKVVGNVLLRRDSVE